MPDFYLTQSDGLALRRMMAQARGMQRLHPPPQRRRRGSPGGGVVSTETSIKFVLIEKTIKGATEIQPFDNVDYQMSAEDILAGYVVKYQDPPDTDHTKNLVSNLSLMNFRRKKLSLKQFTDDPFTGTGSVAASAAVGTQTIKLASSESSVDDYFVGDTINIGSGQGSGQTKTIKDYAGDTKIATVDSAWETALDITSQYTITSSLEKSLATTVVTDETRKWKIVQYVYTTVYYDDTADFEVQAYTRADYPDYPENEAFPPDGNGTYEKPSVDFLNGKYRGITIDDILMVIFCKRLPPPALTPR